MAGNRESAEIYDATQRNCASDGPWGLIRLLQPRVILSAPRYGRYTAAGFGEKRMRLIPSSFVEKGWRDA
ncbi:MAG: hypothetical protein ABI963_02705, partial [Rhizomicrobium sp.]